MRRPAIIAVAVAVLAADLWAQQPQTVPHAGYVYPAGAQAGTTVRVTIGGQFLDGAARVLVSGSGVEAKVIEHDKPITGLPLNAIREKIQQLQQNARDTSVQEELRALREQVAESVRRTSMPALSELVTIEITAAPDAPSGMRQLRLETTAGLTNPVFFQIGKLPEYRERDVKTGADDGVLDLALPAVVNGRMIPGDSDRVRNPLRAPTAYMPGDVDRYRFSARKGQDIVVVVSARDLMPYLADAVPGWFQATVALVDDRGRELVYEDDFRFHPDPVLHYHVPVDGRYTVVIKDALDRGRDDFVYRIAIGELPFITSVFPLGGRAGSVAKVDLTGWNLSAARVQMDLRDKPDASSSKLVPFAVDTLPEVLEREPNNTLKTAQSVSLPCIVNGKIEQPGDWDVFRFEGRAGDAIVAEVVARRLESPIDSVIELVDSRGERVARNDDFQEQGRGLETHHADSRIIATLPASGSYFLRIGDIQHKGGAEFGYRLRVSPPRPDFELWISPSSVNAPFGTTTVMTATAVRKDGFDGDIDLALKSGPAGLVLSGARIPSGQDQVRLTITMPIAPSTEPAAFHVEGRATIAGRVVVHEATPAEEMTQAFAFRHLVQADELRASVGARGGTRVPPKILATTPVLVPAGGTALVRVAAPPVYVGVDRLEVALSDAPDGVTATDVRMDRNVMSFTVHADAGKIKAGLCGNLIAIVSGERQPPPGTPAPAARRRVQLGMLPAIPFQVTTPSGSR